MTSHILQLTPMLQGIQQGVCHTKQPESHHVNMIESWHKL